MNYWPSRSLPDLKTIETFATNKRIFSMRDTKRVLPLPITKKPDNAKDEIIGKVSLSSTKMYQQNRLKKYQNQPRRSYSMFFAAKLHQSPKMPVIYDEKTLELSNDEETNKLELNDAQKKLPKNQVEKELDSGLCSASEGSTDQLISSSAYTLKEKSASCQTSCVDIINETKNDELSFKPFTKSRNVKSCKSKGDKSKGSSFKSVKSIKKDKDHKQNLSNPKIDSAISSSKLSSTSTETFKEHKKSDEKLSNKNLHSNRSSRNKNHNELAASTETLLKSSIQNLDKSAANAIVTAAAAATGLQSTDETLQKLIDMVMPPLAISSSFNLSNNDDVAELSIMMHQNINKAQCGDQKTGATTANSNNTTVDNNEQIMRKCLVYLDHINQKHVRQRQLKIIKNKISGLVLLAIVFCIILILGFVISVFLVRSIATSANSSSRDSHSTYSTKKQTGDFESHDSDLFFMPTYGQRYK